MQDGEVMKQGFSNICGAARRDGKPCGRPAGWGTNHNGYGHCKNHGGSTPGGKKHAAKEEALQMTMTVMGDQVEIDPHDAILLCVRISAGEVAYSSMKVQQLEDAIVYPETTVDKEGGQFPGVDTTTHKAELDIWIQTRHGAMERLAKFSKMALDAGIAERQVRVAEQYGQSIADLLSMVFEGLGLTERQKKIAPGVVREALQTLEGRAIEA